MTRIIITLISIAGIGALASCTTVKEQEPSTHTASSTTTESTSLQQPAATETQTVRSY